jgi:quinol monooxygenase YgiN
MYGTVAFMRVKPGSEEALMAQTRSFRDLNVPGHVGECVYRMDSDPNLFVVAVIFESKEAYLANAQDPAQDARYQEMRALLAADPEWHDGEIIDTFMR